MNWGNPQNLYLLFLLPVFMIFMYVYHKRRNRYYKKFCDEKLIPFHNQNFSNFYYNLRTVVLMISYIFLVIALARPQWDREIRVVESFGQDLVFVIDVSKSMDAQDINPTRLSRAKTQINLFLDELKGDRVAVVAFAGNAVLACPLTTDYAALKLVVSNLSTETVTNYGTNIGEALKVAALVFEKEINAKTLILLSDGEDLEAKALEQASLLAQEGIVLYSIGIGTPEGSPLLIENEKGQNEYAKDDKGNVVITRVDVVGLHRLAEITNGQFFMITPNYSEIFEILKQIQNNEKTKFSTHQYFRFKEQYHFFLFLALMFLVMENLIVYKIREV